jgi:peptide deformylase
MPVKPQHLHIVHYPHPALRAKAKLVAEVNEEVRAVAGRMIELMHEAKGVGLAAPQVALGWRMFVANPTGNPEDNRLYINPVLSKPSVDTGPREEGCLSIPGVYGQIMRPLAITITATDLEGNTFTDSSDELLARIWQHETDHLDGVLILDRMTPSDKDANRRQLRQLEREYGALRA